MGAGQLKFLYFGAYSFRYIFVFLFFLVFSFFHLKLQEKWKENQGSLPKTNWNQEKLNLNKIGVNQKLQLPTSIVELHW